jgi:hypothetical protein
LRRPTASGTETGFSGRLPWLRTYFLETFAILENLLKVLSHAALRPVVWFGLIATGTVRLSGARRLCRVR